MTILWDSTFPNASYEYQRALGTQEDSLRILAFAPNPVKLDAIGQSSGTTTPLPQAHTSRFRAQSSRDYPQTRSPRGSTPDGRSRFSEGLPSLDLAADSRRICRKFFKRFGPTLINTPKYHPLDGLIPGRLLNAPDYSPPRRFPDYIDYILARLLSVW